MLEIINNQIDKSIQIWLNSANITGRELVYYVPMYRNRNSLEIPLFASPEDFEGESPEDKWLVPNALRVIEPESVIHVIR